MPETGLAKQRISSFLIFEPARELVVFTRGMVCARIFVIKDIHQHQISSQTLCHNDYGFLCEIFLFISVSSKDKLRSSGPSMLLIPRSRCIPTNINRPSRESKGNYYMVKVKDEKGLKLVRAMNPMVVMWM